MMQYTYSIKIERQLLLVVRQFFDWFIMNDRHIARLVPISNYNFFMVNLDQFSNQFIQAHSEQIHFCMIYHREKKKTDIRNAIRNHSSWSVRNWNVSLCAVFVNFAALETFAPVSKLRIILKKNSSFD